MKLENIAKCSITLQRIFHLELLHHLLHEAILSQYLIEHGSKLGVLFLERGIFILKGFHGLLVTNVGFATCQKSLLFIQDLASFFSWKVDRLVLDLDAMVGYSGPCHLPWGDCRSGSASRCTGSLQFEGFSLSSLGT